MNPIEQARNFVMNTVQLPALASSSLPSEAKYKVRSSNIWLSKFTRVGDLLHYLNRFDAQKDDPLYLMLKAHGLKTFEDIKDEFRTRYAAWEDDRTRPSDFVIGERYSPHEILIFANTYDTRAGGMFVMPGEGSKPAGVVIKATLQGGAYPNQWLEKGTRLKYFFKAINGKFDGNFQVNAAILQNPGLPVLAFVRESSAEEFTYYGVFELDQPHIEADGSKWFELVFASQQPAGVVAEGTFVQKQLEEKVAKAKLDPREARLARLKTASSTPVVVTVLRIEFVRNPDVIAEVLYLAGGTCGACGKSAPFNRSSDGSPYLEVHHRKPLAEGGEDAVQNAIALCPNCHRQRHFG